ncbi:16222_t:CDS:2, partial [Racocetra fulgida]
AKLSADTLSVKRFYDDIEKFQKEKSLVAGTLLDTETGEYRPDIALKECFILFSEANFKKKVDLKQFHWDLALSDIKRVASRLRALQKLQNIRPKAWYEKYQETYTIENPSNYLLSMPKKIAGILLPPYGAYLIWKMKNVRKEMEKTKAKKMLDENEKTVLKLKTYGLILLE